MKSLIQKLVETPGPSGYESKVRDLVRAEIEPLVDELRVDQMGNLIARKGRKVAGGSKVMLAAHLDEVGVVVTHIDEQGFARFLPVGELDPLTCLGSRVRFLNGVMGVIGGERLADEKKTPDFGQLFIDLGYSNRAECPLRVGDAAVFIQPFIELGERLVGKALDDRIGVALLVEVLRQLQVQKIQSAHELFFVFSVQEQAGDAAQPALLLASTPTWGWQSMLRPAATHPPVKSWLPGWGKVRLSGYVMSIRCSIQVWWSGW